MLKIAILLWSLAYIFPISKHLISLWHIKKGLRKLVDFVAVYGSSNAYPRPQINEYKDELTALLRYYPAISQFVAYPELSYSQTDELTYQNACKIISELQMKINEVRHSLVLSFNPLRSLRELALLPSYVLTEIGFHPGRLSTVILNTIGWAITYLLGMFQSEIKILLLTLIEKFIGA